MSQISKIDLLRIFKENLLLFLNELIIQLPNESELLTLKVMFSQSIPIEDALQIFSMRILPHADMVTNRNDKFFLECTDLFEGVQSDKVSYFKKLWNSPNITKDDKDKIWEWFDFFLKIAKKYSAMIGSKK